MKWELQPKESHLVTFGFSAFLKLLSLNERPRRTALRQRLSPSAGGYDFHRSFRLHARRLLVDGVAVDDVLTSAGTITKLPERRSAVAALQRLDLWRRSAPGPVFQGEPVIYESPRRLFRVRFEPDFSIRLKSGSNRTRKSRRGLS
ncbi:MAG: hypothetical protein E7K72_21025, partial [Roseomonas mucosa]|nr:hypothetical protein [Roseomonas mucosa]